MGESWQILYPGSYFNLLVSKKRCRIRRVHFTYDFDIYLRLRKAFWSLRDASFLLILRNAESNDFFEWHCAFLPLLGALRRP